MQRGDLFVGPAKFGQYLVGVLAKAGCVQSQGFVVVAPTGESDRISGVPVRTFGRVLIIVQQVDGLEVRIVGDVFEVEDR